MQAINGVSAKVSAARGMTAAGRRGAQATIDLQGRLMRHVDRGLRSREMIGQQAEVLRPRGSTHDGVRQDEGKR